YIFVAVLSWIFIKEKITLQKAIGIAVIIAGIVIYSVKW
ncbi:MAG: EamA family transporter, partial [Lachnospiraceae bacterium]|nr:EamA family transporter [Lachnospiraceae bacterium]